MKFCATLLLAFLPLLIISQKKQNNFDVFYKDKKIGTAKATEVVNGKTTSKELQTNTSSSVLMMKVLVESEISAVYENSIMTKSVSYRYANRGNENIEGTTTRTGTKTYEVTINGKTSKLDGKEITYCVVDLYFTEPSGITEVYSNMYGKFLPLLHLGSHKYKLSLPDGKNAYYTYTNGELTLIEVEMSLGTVVSKKV